MRCCCGSTPIILGHIIIEMGGGDELVIQFIAAAAAFDCDFE
jgi:hypothetical protein